MATKKKKRMIPAGAFIAIKWSAALAVFGVVVVTAVVSQAHWRPKANEVFAYVSTSINNDSRYKSNDAGHDDAHAGHDDAHAGHDEGNSIELSRQARKSIGLTTTIIELQPYTRCISIPATVTGRPGRSQFDVTAPLGGRVTRVYPIEGEAIEPGKPLFDLRLTHEELVKAQSDFLRSAEELDVELREIKRLKSAGAAIAGKTLRQREYEKQKLEATINAQRQSLLLHGLTKQQIDGIVKDRTLVQGVTVMAPRHPKNGYKVAPTHPFTLRTLNVKSGQYVDAGAQLCLLVDYAELYIQGRAFEHDVHELMRAATEKWEVTGVVDDGRQEPHLIKGLEIVYVDNEVDPESRALSFFVRLPNKIVQEGKSPDGHRFLSWQYRPGQRMQLRVPVERWEDRIVLPVDAVANEGVEHYVFQQNGIHFDRVPVQVEYQDQLWTVIANDGSLFPGDTVASSGAHQLQMALKNKAGGGVDPHAGHNH